MAEQIEAGELPPHAHLWPRTARMDAAGHLSIAGMDVGTLAHTYGTPLYVFDEVTIREQCRAFRSALAAHWPASAVAYAGKAYLSPALCRLLQEEGMELDAVSAGEVAIALAAGYPARLIHLHGNYKPDVELAYALSAGVGRVVVDSLDELDRLAALAEQTGRTVPIWLRVCPDVDAETHAYTRTGHVGSKFGLDLAGGEVAEAARRALAAPALDLVGLHAHVGSQLMNLAPVARVVSLLGECAATLRERVGARIRELSPGGGLGVAYVPEDAPPAVEAYARVVAESLADAVARGRLEPLRVIVETGRAIVARAGVALYTVGPRKVSATGAITLAVDGGMGDNPRPALYGARYVAALAARMSAPVEEPVRIVGRYCESGDVLVEAADLPRARYGEVLAIPVSGAYHLPMASAYNLVPRPAVLFLREGVARLVRRRETVEDLLALERG